jgi:hypothetical protein
MSSCVQGHALLRNSGEQVHVPEMPNVTKLSLVQHRLLNPSQISGALAEVVSSWGAIGMEEPTEKYQRLVRVAMHANSWSFPFFSVTIQSMCLSTILS